MQTYWEKFESMGTEIILSAYLEETKKNLLVEARKTICDFSDRFSRFLRQNELWELNNAGGRKIQTSPMMVELLAAMQKFQRETAGIFDPTVIGALEAAGYDRDFDSIGKNKVQAPPEKNRANAEEWRHKYFARVPLTALKISGRTLQAPNGFRVDTGGNGKGFIIDYVARKFFSEVENYWLSAGGDLLLSGHAKSGQGWEIGVQDPMQPQRDSFILKTDGRKVGVATSGIIKRQWQKDGTRYHHLIDPRSGLSVKNDILSVTAIASQASHSDVFAKTVLILGEEEGLEFIEKQKGAECIIFFRHKQPLLSSGMYKYIK